MKKILLMLALFAAVLTTSAQIATENSKVFDNVSVGVTTGVSTPLDFNSTFPLNTNVGLKIIKDITPVIGFQIEGIAILNDNHFTDLKTLVKATNVGLNGTINLSNLVLGYKGTPRLFEISTVSGLGWAHTWDTSTNNLTAKTGLDLAFNLGKKKAHSLVLTPAVYWNLNPGSKIQFSKHNAQLALNVSYVYHFKTSNGTHHFKTYNIKALNEEINTLRSDLDTYKNCKPKTVEVEKVVEKKVVVPTPCQWIVQFAQNSAELTKDATKLLDTIGEDAVVDIVGTASPEGSAEYNKRLSEKRAANVATYLDKRGVRVNSWVGKGAQIGASTNRLVIVTVAQ